MKRSPGQGGATGCTANTARCAVLGCFQKPGPWVCPYDGRRHGHGAIHYDSGYPDSALTFRQGDWFWICEAHYQVLCAERAEWERKRHPERG